MLLELIPAVKQVDLKKILPYVEVTSLLVYRPRMTSRCILILYFEKSIKRNGNGRMTDLHLENFQKICTIPSFFERLDSKFFQSILVLYLF